MNVIALAGVLITAAGAASAQTMTTDCSKFGLTAEINDCQDKAFKDADAQLNKEFGKVAACVRTSEENRARLIRSQTIWVKFRDAECLLRNGTPDQRGTLYSSDIDECKTQLTFRRLQELKLYTKCISKSPAMCPSIDCKSFENDWRSIIRSSASPASEAHP